MQKVHYKKEYLSSIASIKNCQAAFVFTTRVTSLNVSCMNKRLSLPTD